MSKTNKRADLDEDALSSLGFKIYVLLLESKEPLSVRDIARTLDVSPSTVHYHIKKLVKLGLVRSSEQGYVVTGKVALEDYVVVGRKIVPRLLVYSFFFLGLLIGLLIVVLYRGEFTVDSLVAFIASFTAFTLLFFEGYKYRKRILPS